MITVSLWEISHPCVLMKENWGSPRPAQMNRRVSRELTYKAVKQQGNACKVPAARPGPAPPPPNLSKICIIGSNPTVSSD